jgi:hypothetical protein
VCARARACVCIYIYIYIYILVCIYIYIYIKHIVKLTLQERLKSISVIECSELEGVSRRKMKSSYL